MFRENFFIFLLLFVFVVSVECKTCQTLDIRNNVTDLNKLTGCTEIVGYLRIVLIENAKDFEFDNYVFPELTRITGHLFFFNVKKLTSIGRMFPNLMVIRGLDLFTDYSLIIYNMPDLREIGLSKLMYIARGFVIVDKCPHLCYAETIDWHRIGTTLHINNMNRDSDSCEPCPRECEGYCWNSMTCQKRSVDDCHQECLGCTKSNSADHCWSCKNFDDHGTCVAECPNDKSPQRYKHVTSFKCLTAEECTSKLNGTWWIHDNECLKECPASTEPVIEGNITVRCRECGDNCSKWCNVTKPIEAMDTLQGLRGCTHLNGSLVIRFSGVKINTENTMVEDFNKYLGSIRYISDYLVVMRSNAIKSMGFLKNLKTIEGKNLKNDKYAVLFYENQNLQKLWDVPLKLKILNGTIGFQNNPQLCPSQIRELAVLVGLSTNFSTQDVYGNGDHSACNYINLTANVNATSTNAMLTWDSTPLSGNDSYVGVTVYYIEHEDGNISTYESKDVCDDWGWKSQFTTNNSVFLNKLKPYTRYAYYLNIYQISMEQTNVSYFRTKSDDPDMPDHFAVLAVDYQTVKLVWIPPKKPNGVLAYYKLYVNMVFDIETHYERDYCVHPITVEGLKIDSDWDGILDKLDLNRTSNITSNKYAHCSCPTEEPEPEHQFFTCNKHYPLCELQALSKFGMDECKHMVYDAISDLEDTASTPISIKKRGDPNGTVKKSNPYQSSTNFSVTIDANLTEYNLMRLKHFTMYIFYFAACNVEDKCGPVVQDFIRTKKNESADDVEIVQTTVENSNVVIEWSEPKNPNGAVVSYNIVYNKTDLEHSKPTTECFARNRRLVTNRLSLTNLLPGSYAVSVQAVSLAGSGRVSQFAFFDIAGREKDFVWVMPFVIVVLIVTAVGVLLFIRHRKQKTLDDIHLIAMINPEYDGAVYVEDEWEIERNDIELQCDLGHGTFGTVYCGLIKSRNISCAIKTVNENVTLHDRMEFLNEASVMKSFSNSHHVVKLLGVVSKGQPPLVIMELMERGDLKKYLRRTRDSSQNITANEIYRMAIEIADGMAYLAAKKFVHRDLAARNCMVDDDRTVKIGDFGMARDIYETDYYRKETKGLLPVRWMAPESLADGVFTSDSDVWSYGIVLWEIATLAEQPYQGLSNEQVLQFIVSKGRLDRPLECPDLLYEIMDACWCWRPNDRPTFADIVERLDDHVGKDFKLVSYIHSREGLEHRMNHGRERTYNPPALGMGAQEHDFYGGDNASDEEVSLYVGDSSRPRFLPSSLSQRKSRHSPSDLY